MRIIPMMVVLICASGPSWKASSLEVRIPRLGLVKMEFQPDTTSESTVTERQGSEDAGKQATQPTTESDNNKPAEASTKATPQPKNDNQTPQKNGKKPSETPPNSPTASKKPGKQPAKPTKATAKQTTAKPKDGGKSSATTQDPKQTQNAASHPDDFDDSDIWGDTKDPPKDFGRQYDLDPSLLQSGGNDLGDFQPNLQLPPNMTKDMFFKAPADGNSPGQGGGDDAEGNGLFDRIRRFFSIANVKEELDTIPGKMQTLMDGFRQKKADGLKKLREKMDGCADKVRQKIAEAFSKLKAPKHNSQQCAGQIEESFKQYEAALQGGIQPCLDKVQSVTGAQEGALQNAQAKFGQTLANMRDCVSKLESSGVGSLFKSVLNVGSCTKKNIQSKIEDSLQPQMKRLSQMVQQQGSQMSGNMNKTGLCVERQLQLPKFQKLQQELVGKGKKCLERSR